MAFFIVHILGIILGFIGVILTIIVTSMAQWRVSYMVEGNAMDCNKRIDGQFLSRWDGLWVTCVSQQLNSMDCGGYDTQVSITTDLKTGRVLMSFAVVLSIIAIIIALIALLINQCCGGKRGSRHCLYITAGVILIVSAILVFIPIVWTTANIIIAINNPVCKTIQRQEIGEAVVLGWPTILFLLIPGVIFCWPYPYNDNDSIDSFSESSIPRPVYVQCQDQEKIPNDGHYSRTQYV